MKSVTTNRIRRRLRSLALLELANIPLQAFIWFGLVGFPVTPTNIMGFSLFALLLWWGLRIGPPNSGRCQPQLQHFPVFTLFGWRA
jgi:heme A synthase